MPLMTAIAAALRAHNGDPEASARWLLTQNDQPGADPEIRMLVALIRAVVAQA